MGSFLNLTAYYPAGVGFTIGPPRGTYTFAKVNDKGEYLSGSEWEITFDSFGLKIYVGDNKRDIDGDSISTVPEDKRGIDSDGWSETERGYGFDKEGRIWIPDANDEPGVVSISHYSIAEVFDMLRNRLSFYGGVVPPSSYELEEMKDMFTIKEHKAPNGYLKTNDAKRSFFMSSIGGKHLMVNTLGSFKNIKPGMLHFKKVDEKGNPLPGSTWKIVHTKSGKEYIVEDDSSGNPFKGDLVEEIGKDILANPGDIDIPLPPGTYTVQELKAPEGYKLDPTVHTAVLDPKNSGDGGVYEDFLGTITNTPEKPTEEPTPSPSDSPEPSPSESPEPSPSESPEPSPSPSDTPTPTTQETTPEGSTTPEIPPTTPSVPEVSTTPQTPVETTETTPPVVTTPEEPEETPETTPSSPVPPTTVKVTEVTTKEHPPIKVTETEREQVPPTPVTVVEKETE